jgi:hypothetical protein
MGALPLDAYLPYLAYAWLCVRGDRHFRKRHIGRACTE